MPIIIPGIKPANDPPWTIKNIAPATAPIAPIVRFFIMEYSCGLSCREKSTTSP
jgi:hypothetical protein